MIYTSGAFRAAMAKKTKRQVFAKVDINYTDPFVDQSIGVTSSGDAECSHINQVADGIYEPSHNWFSLDGSSLLDGSYVLMPPTDDTLAELSMEMGWWSASVSGAGGTFASAQTLTVVFAERAIERLLVCGDSIKNEYPVDFTIKLYDASNTLLHTETVTANTLYYWSTNITSVAAVVKQVLSITKWSHVGRCAKIYEFFTSLRRTYYGDEVFSMELLEERQSDTASVPIGNISSNQLTLRLHNKARQFDYGSTSPLANLAKPMRKIEPYIGALGVGDATAAYLTMATDIPDIPDKASGVTQLITAFTSAAAPTGWSPSLSPSFSLSGSKLVITATAINSQIYRAMTALKVRIKVSAITGTWMYGISGTFRTISAPGLIDFYVASSAFGLVANAAGNTITLEILYLGTGEYDTDTNVIDNTSNGNDMTVYGATPSADGLIFGGNVDYLIRTLATPQEIIFAGISAKVTGATGVVLSTFKYNSGSGGSGFLLYKISASSARIYVGRTGTTSQYREIAYTWDATAEHDFAVRFDLVTRIASLFVDGVLVGSTAAYDATMNLVASYLVVGRGYGDFSWDYMAMTARNAIFSTREVNATELAYYTQILEQNMLYTSALESFIEWVPLGTFWSQEWNVPDEDLGVDTVGFDLLSLMAETEYSPGLQTGLSFYDMFEDICQDYGLLSSMYFIDPDLDADTIPYSYLEKTSHRESLRMVAEACQASVYVDRYGVLRIEGPDYLRANRAISERTITSAKYFTRSNPSRFSNIKNVVKVQYSPLVPDVSASQVYSATDISISAGEVLNMTINYSETPVIDAAAALVSPPGSITITDATYYPWGADIEITNASGAAAIIELEVNAKVLRVTGGGVATSRDESSISEFGEKVYEFPDNPLIQDANAAYKIANQVLTMYSTPRRDLKQAWRGDPALELSDKITTDASRTTTEDFWLVRQELTFDGTLRSSQDGILVVADALWLTEDGYMWEAEDGYLWEVE